MGDLHPPERIHSGRIYDIYLYDAQLTILTIKLSGYKLANENLFHNVRFLQRLIQTLHLILYREKKTDSEILRMHLICLKL